ncbi:hypothetical protein [Arcticibacter tournemirensis]
MNAILTPQGSVGGSTVDNLTYRDGGNRLSALTESVVSPGGLEYPNPGRHPAGSV